MTTGLSVLCVIWACVLTIQCAADLVMYTDSVAAGVQDGTWAQFRSASATSPTPHTGTYCYSTQITDTPQWSAWYFFGFSLTVSSYTSISLWYNPGPVNTQQLQVVLQTSAGGALGPSLNLNTFASGGTFPTNAWTRVIIDFVTNFGLSYTDVVGRVYLQTSTGLAQPVFYLDDIVAVSRALATCTGAPNCDTLNRTACDGTLANTCGPCKAGFNGASGYGNTGCTAPPSVGGVSVVINGNGATFPVSRWIYGLNDKYTGWGSNYATEATVTRSGGNRLTGWNWENGFSNAGSDYFYSNDQLITNSQVPGAGVRPMINQAFAADSTAVLLTIPCIGYVSRNRTGNAPIPSAVNRNSPAVPSTNFFVPMLPNNPAGPGVGIPHTELGPVYADDLVKWFNQNYPGRASHPTAAVFWSLDNEPDLWGSTHAEIRGTVGGASGTANEVWVGMQELVDKNAAVAAAAKSIMPTAKTFGPVHYGWGGIRYLQNYYSWPQTMPSGISATSYTEYYLDRMKAAAGSGPRLLDVFDLHWYPEAKGDGQRVAMAETSAQGTGQIDARMQAPRSFWDPTYVETSWIAQDDLGNQPIQLFNRIKTSITKTYPGTEIGVTEYFFGRIGDISGAVAHADCLGIFAREKIYAATVWPFSDFSGYSPATANNANKGLMAAFKSFLNYDGVGSRFGDTYVETTVTDPGRPVDPGRTSQTLERITAYSSTDSSNIAKRTLVVINKSQTNAIGVSFSLNTPSQTFTSARAYQVTGTNGATSVISGPTRLADITFPTNNQFTATLPPMSITTFAMTAEASVSSSSTKSSSSAAMSSSASSSSAKSFSSSSLVSPVSSSSSTPPPNSSSSGKSSSSAVLASSSSPVKSSSSAAVGPTSSSSSARPPSSSSLRSSSSATVSSSSLPGSQSSSSIALQPSSSSARVSSSSTKLSSSSAKLSSSSAKLSSSSAELSASSAKLSSSSAKRSSSSSSAKPPSSSTSTTLPLSSSSLPSAKPSSSGAIPSDPSTGSFENVASTSLSPGAAAGIGIAVTLMVLLLVAGVAWRLCPRQPKPDAVPPTGGAMALSGITSGAASSASASPQGWVRKVDPVSQRTFYYNSVTHLRQWERPEGVPDDDVIEG